MHGSGSNAGQYPWQSGTVFLMGDGLRSIFLPHGGLKGNSAALLAMRNSVPRGCVKADFNEQLCRVQDKPRVYSVGDRDILKGSEVRVPKRNPSEGPEGQESRFPTFMDQQFQVRAMDLDYGQDLKIHGWESCKCSGS